MADSLGEAKPEAAKRQLHKLSAKFAETTTRPGRHSDGGGLYLAVRPGGSRSWVFMFKQRGKLHEMGLGSFDARGQSGFSLAQARARAVGARALVRDGVNPLLAHKQNQNGGIVEKSQTFGAFADGYLVSIQSRFRGSKTVVDWKRNIEVYAEPLREIAIDQISTDDVLNVLKPLWETRFRTAREFRGKIEQVLDAAKVKGLRSGENPARWKGHLQIILGRGQKRKTKHHPAPPYRLMPEIIRKLRERHAIAATSASLALEYAILTAARTNEVRAMRVAEIDLAHSNWNVPAARMKMAEDHVVPLSDRAKEILSYSVPTDASPNNFVFSGSSANESLGLNALLNTLKAVADGMTTHGRRRPFARPSNFARSPRAASTLAMCWSATRRSIRASAPSRFRTGSSPAAT
ncbi:tyrosine-type recombinase/integrase [Tardiphaga sp. 1201_B9_N1_1]|uniref:tyrosine-type recombinase/integrase n=1 Tax=unclassified Tardiphaga TaxID=2631404 RepID=UPI003F23C724